MADERPLPDANRGSRPARRPAAGTPRWVKAVGIVTVVLILLFFAAHFAGVAPFMQHGG